MFLYRFFILLINCILVMLLLFALACATPFLFMMPEAWLAQLKAYCTQLENKGNGQP